LNRKQFVRNAKRQSRQRLAGARNADRRFECSLHKFSPAPIAGKR